MTADASLRATVVIVGYNGEDFLRPCLDSVAGMNVPPAEYELLLIDNASADGTVAVMEGFRERFPNLKIVRNERNVGFAAAVNQAAALATSSILVLLNQDTVVDRGWLQELLKPFEGDPAVGVVGSRVLNGDGPGLYAAALEVLYGGVCIVHEGDRRTDAVSGCAMAVRLDAFRRIGGFAEDLFMYGEDLDLGHRLRQAGYRIAYARKSEAHHRATRTARASTRTYVFYMARNRVLICVRNYPKKRLYLLTDIFVLFPLTALSEWFRSRRRWKAIGWLLEARIDSLRTAFAWIRSGARGIRGDLPTTF